MDVFGNVAFPLRMRRIGRSEIRRRVASALEKVHLPNIEGRKPQRLAVGHHQRVALARALVYNANLLLLDEPFGALDRKLREDMQLEIVRLHNELDVTIINVTHDQREALIMSDRVGVMKAGSIEQIATSEDLYRSPQTRYVAEFIGDATLIDGTVTTDATGSWFLSPSGGRASLAAPSAPGPATLVLRSEIVEVGAALATGTPWNTFEGT